VTGERITPRRILVATDFSVPAQAALARAGQLAAQHGARLGLLHVLPDELDVDQDRVRAKEVIIAPGHPPTKLVEQCDSRGADLIVTGTGARSPAAVL
jgi:nucleotide-binding universal stress UspA family protein